MDYSDTGNFSKEQKALCRKIKELNERFEIVKE